MANQLRISIGKIAIFDIIIAMKIHVLVLDKVFDTGLATVLDAFQTANELAGAFGMGSAKFEVTLVSVRKSVRTAQGFNVPVQAIGKQVPDLVVVPAIAFKMPEPLEAALASREVQDGADALRAWDKQGATVAAACIGTFIMAESGLLANHRATTTWWLAPLFKKRYPNVDLDQSSMIVKSGRLITAGAGLESHGSGAMADSAEESEACGIDGKVFDC